MKLNRRWFIKWFKHQADANLNAKLQEVILDHGMEGYGLYWFCLELVAMNVSSTKLTFELEHDARIISRMAGMPVAKVELIMRDFINLDLFSASEGRIQCLKLAKRSDDFTAKAIKQNGLQSLEFKEVRQSPTKSDKVPLEEEDRSKKIEDRTERSDRLDYEKIKDIFNTNLTKAASVVKLTDKRKRLVKKLFCDFDLDYEKFGNYLTFLNEHPDTQWMFEKRPKNDGSGQNWNPQTFEYFVGEKCFLNAKENLQ